MSNVARMLNRLAELQTEKEHLEAPYRDQMREATTRINQQITDLEGKIRRATLRHRTTYHGTALSAVYQPGRVSWDSRRLEGFMVEHPELGQFQRRGRPFVQIRPRR